MNLEKKGILVVVSGFSGSGKGTIMKELLKSILSNTHFPFRQRQDSQEKAKQTA